LLYLTKLLEKVSLAFLALFVAVMMAMVFLSVIGRFWPIIYFPWYQEVSTGCFIWVGFLGASIGVKQGGHFLVDVVSKRFKKTGKKYLSLMVYLLVLIVSVIMLRIGYDFTKLGMMTISPLTKLPSTWIYISVPIGASLSLIYSIEKILAVLGILDTDYEII